MTKQKRGCLEGFGFEFFIVEDRVKVRHSTDHSSESLFKIETRTNKKDAIAQAINNFNRSTEINNE